MKTRKCNQFGCDGLMRPTKKMHSENHRIFRCVICGKENPWVSDPKLNGSFGELHLVDGGSSGLSCMSDPLIYGYKKE